MSGVATDLFGHDMLPVGVTPKRGKPYLWVTWLSPLLAGDDSCELQTWFKTHYRFDYVEGRNFDLDAWKAEHATRVRALADELKAEGWNVTVEDQNKFTLEAHTALIGGKPDVITGRDGIVRVIDSKRKPRAADYCQVLLYMYALPKVAGSYPKNLQGELVYADGTVRVVTPTELTKEFVGNLAGLVRRIVSPTRPVAVPSGRECAFCKVPKYLCPDRNEDELGMHGTTEDF